MIKIGDFQVQNFGSPYIVAELASNHNGDMNLAKRLIDEAKEVGCHCVKFQSWTADSIFSGKVYRDNYFLNDDYRDRKDYSLREIVEKFSISEKQLFEMREYCDKKNIDFASTPFSQQEVDYLVDVLRAKFIKVASMDCNNYPFLEYVGRKGLPIMLSTGLASLWEVARAVETLENAGNRDIILLHCVSHYPPMDEEVNLNNMDMFRSLYPSYPVGFSDHTIGYEIPLAAVGKGACVIEKHFTLDKDMFGWDHKVSATKEEMRIIVSGSLRISKALGSPVRAVTEKDLRKREAFRRSVVAARDIRKGERFSWDNLCLKRPGTGIPPERMEAIINRIARKAVKRDEMIQDDDF
ncbi:MAG: N-acetylneuraminate synthase family protein [Deltaproteobacteria bacterium]|nr:N-acetylneuraminate synthase family protein [Deltaproteobacteria bacterium]MBW2063914.1 N-acetylneuraminate synthase family protein [Deltaproteobacteria bacterium]